MVRALEIEWIRPPENNTQMRPEDFKDILRRRIERVTFLPMAPKLSGLLIRAKTHDELGREKYKISINSNDPKIEQAKTLVHEIAHIHYESPYANLLEQFRVEEDKYEDFIEEETQRFFVENSDLVMQAFAFLRLGDNVSKGHPFGVIS